MILLHQTVWRSEPVSPTVSCAFSGQNMSVSLPWVYRSGISVMAYITIESTVLRCGERRQIFEVTARFIFVAVFTFVILSSIFLYHFFFCFTEPARTIRSRKPNAAGLTADCQQLRYVKPGRNQTSQLRWRPRTPRASSFSSMTPSGLTTYD